jgi:hypothetical protein
MERVERYLKEQARLLRERLATPKKRSKPRRSWPDSLETFHTVLDTVFKLFIALLSAAVIGGAVAVTWSAVGSTGDVVQPISVSTTLQDRGLTGPVLAQRIVDHWNFMMQRSLATRPAAPNGIQVAPPDVPLKVEFSDTGVTLGEIYTFFHSLLSQEKYLTGEAYEGDGAAKYTLTMRNGDSTRPPCSSRNSSMDLAVDQVAGCMLMREQPYRYAVYLASIYQGKEGDDPCEDNLPPKQARNVLEAYVKANPVDTATPKSREEIGWAQEELGYRFKEDCGDFATAISDFGEAVDTNNNFAIAYSDEIDAEKGYGEDDAALNDIATLLWRLQHPELMNADAYRTTLDELKAKYEAESLADVGSYEAAAEHDQSAMGSPNAQDDAGFAAMLEHALLTDLARAHDLPALRKAWAAAKPAPGKDLSFLVAMQFEQWPQARALAEDAAATCTSDDDCIVERTFYPNVMNVYAQLGLKMKPSDEDLIPVDDTCYACLYQRGVKYASQWQQWDGTGLWLHRSAAYWFGKAFAVGPSLPFAHLQWAALLFKQKRYDRAIAELQFASGRAPNYAEVPELWAEVLLAMGRPADALAKLQEAEKDAPNWQRVHLMQAKALAALNRPADAATQSRIAQADGFTDQDRELFGLSCLGKCKAAAH